MERHMEGEQKQPYIDDRTRGTTRKESWKVEIRLGASSKQELDCRSKACGADSDLGKGKGRASLLIIHATASANGTVG
jgi:hypothetical protein